MSQLIQGLHSFNDMKTLALWSDSSIVIYDTNTENNDNQHDHIEQITSKLQKVWPEWKKIPIYAINIHQEKTSIDHHQMTNIFYQTLHQCKNTIHSHCKLQLEIYYR